MPDTFFMENNKVIEFRIRVYSLIIKNISMFYNNNRVFFKKKKKLEILICVFSLESYQKKKNDNSRDKKN